MTESSGSYHTLTNEGKGRARLFQERIVPSCLESASSPLCTECYPD